MVLLGGNTPSLPNRFEDIVMKRRKMSRNGSKSYFTATASKTHYKNVPTTAPMRGGIRM